MNQVDTEKEEFEKAWVSDYVPTGTAADAINEIKVYAYSAFDKLDQNGNGFIETDELQSFLKDADTNEREKSFITFLLNNLSRLSQIRCRKGPQLLNTASPDWTWTLISSWFWLCFQANKTARQIDHHVPWVERNLLLCFNYCLNTLVAVSKNPGRHRIWCGPKAFMCRFGSFMQLL